MTSSIPDIVRIVPAVVFLAASIQTQAPPTLRQRAIASDGRPISLPVINETEPVTITELAANANLIVEGRLRFLKSYLSPDEYYIYTDFELVPTQVVLDEENTGARIPGPGDPAIVTLFGGELVIEGTKITMTDHDLSTFSDTSTLLMFLKRTDAPGRRYIVYRSAAGLFEIDAKRNIRALLRGYTSDEIRGERADDILSKIRRVHPKLH